MERWVLAAALVATLVGGGILTPGAALADDTSARAPVPAGPTQPPFESSIERISDSVRNLMTGRSWRRGCPVAIHDLRYLTLRYQTFSGGSRMGELVVHERWADEIVTVFSDLYAAAFPIRRMRLVDHYGANDTRSMRHDNTSAFNCRWRAGSPGVWSQHAYGRAIDVNPVENPYFVPPDYVSPPEGRPYLDRSRDRPGMIHAHDDVVDAFRRIDWRWGGNWNNIKDWQHFSATGK